MTNDINLQSLKTFAKRVARTRRIAHNKALDLVAARLEQPHWNALTSAWERGWRPVPDAIKALVESEETFGDPVMAIPMLGIGQSVEEHGEIDGHPYSVEIDFEVLMRGERWCILLEHAPSEKPTIEIYDKRKTNPARDPAFIAKALVICNAAAERLRARIAWDWPRRSTKPDADGNTQHPLSKDVSGEWFCLHCDGKLTGAEMAVNMWHCPKCSASPLDIFPTAFWRAA